MQGLCAQLTRGFISLLYRSRKASPRSGRPMGDGRIGQFPSPLANVVPCLEATIRLPQYKILLGNMSDFNR